MLIIKEIQIIIFFSHYIAFKFKNPDCSNKIVTYCIHAGYDYGRYQRYCRNSFPNDKTNSDRCFAIPDKYGL